MPFCSMIFGLQEDKTAAISHMNIMADSARTNPVAVSAILASSFIISC